MLTAQNITYLHPDKELLFENLCIAFNNNDKVALVGDNGSGKSTLLKILAGILYPTTGFVKYDSIPYYVPQHFGQYNDYTIAEALQIADKLNALSNILQGNVTDKNLETVGEDWTIEERSREALSFWNLHDFHLTQKMENISGGEKTRIFLAGILIHKPGIVLLDEPTNHLDCLSRKILYDYIQSCPYSLVVVSHDRSLLNLLNPVYELNKNEIKVYGGNYTFYKEQKELEENTLSQELENKEKSLRKAKKVQRETLERKQRQDVRGRKKHEKSGTSRILMNALKDKAEKSSTKLKDIHSGKIASISEELSQSRQKLSETGKIKMDFESPGLHSGKILITASEINHAFGNHPLWNRPLSFQIRSGERINIKGANGSGKTTLIKIILGLLKPVTGIININDFDAVYIDQDYSIINGELSVYGQAQLYNRDGLEEHDIKIRLYRFLFHNEFWDKPCRTLSGGEKMRLMLCCLMINNHAPDMFILDEPTNNLDIQNTEILTSVINDYRGTVIVVSHDQYFLNEINVGQTLELD